MDTVTKQLFRVERLPTGGYGDQDDDFALKIIGPDFAAPKKPTEHCKPADYVPEMLTQPVRSDFKALNVLQPEGASFTVTDNSLLRLGRRAKYARHHVWVTRHADYELWAGGEFTNMSREEEAGCYDAAARNDDVENTDVVAWAVFGFTHSPRVEDWLVMPVERHELHLRPVDFFNVNPALDVPSHLNTASVLVDGECCANGD
ncbi:copper amine oxidase 1 [Metarhizium guizhouense ARSEF 977]|uniref:Amine oxidase n=1 Tax=Metarhizium guizhouense (strain ARSEF 977) TaxID=1276136 RepID=A0A0B4H631_METGA|nr:copper amine oxidase 1 [Metarhizium guizhouense ARSEF 977]